MTLNPKNSYKRIDKPKILEKCKKNKNRHKIDNTSRGCKQAKPTWKHFTLGSIQLEFVLEKKYLARNE